MTQTTALAALRSTETDEKLANELGYVDPSKSRTDDLRGLA